VIEARVRFTIIYSHVKAPTLSRTRHQKRRSGWGMERANACARYKWLYCIVLYCIVLL